MTTDAEHPPPTVFGIHYMFELACATAIATMQVRDKRCIYNSMRRAPLMQVDNFLPIYGMTVGEFSVLNVLASTVMTTNLGGKSRDGEAGDAIGDDDDGDGDGDAKGVWDYDAAFMTQTRRRPVAKPKGKPKPAPK
jgi:hypothetical protein